MISKVLKNYGIKNDETLRISKTKKLPNTRGEYYFMKYTIRGRGAQNALEIFLQQNQINDSRARTVHFLLS